MKATICSLVLPETEALEVTTELVRPTNGDTALSTVAEALPGPTDQGYECCECFGTFEEDIM